MALSQSDLYCLIESLRSAGGLELVRSVAERMLQELIEAEAAAAIGAGGTSTPRRAPPTATDTGTRR
jgi:putative transposase